MTPRKDADIAALTAENHALRAQNAYLAPRRRAGQLVANAMHAVDPVFYEAHRGDFTDPFNEDGRIEAYLRAWQKASVAEIERLDGALTMVLQDEKQDTKDIARLHALVTCEPQSVDLHDHTACVVEEMERLRSVVEAVLHERKVRAEWLAAVPTCAAVPGALVAAEDATGAALDVVTP